MQYRLSPSILSADFGCLAAQIEETNRAGAPYVHIDVMDGVFVPSISYGMPLIRSLRRYTDQIFDVHLMIRDPGRYVAEFADCGADIITFHMEAAKNPHAVIEKIHASGRRAGLAIRPGTAVEKVRPYLKDLDQLLIMSVEPGFGGQAYLPQSTGRIRTARELIREELGDAEKLDVEVDGGINRETIGEALDAGANVIVAGSAIYHGNIYDNCRYYLSLFAEKGTQSRSQQ